jgi:hypothetical protein
MKHRERVPYTLGVRTRDRAVTSRRREASLISNQILLELRSSPLPHRGASTSRTGRKRQHPKYSPRSPAGMGEDGVQLHRPLASTAGRGRRRSSTTRAEDRVLGPLFGDASIQNAVPTGSDHRSSLDGSSNSGQIQISARDLSPSPGKTPNKRCRDRKNLPKKT